MPTSSEILAEKLQRLYFIQENSGLTLDPGCPDSLRQGLHRFVQGASGKTPLYIEAEDDTLGHPHNVLVKFVGLREIPAGGKCGKTAGEERLEYISGDTRLPGKATREDFEKSATNGVFLIVKKP